MSLFKKNKEVTLNERLKGSLIGFIVGDALGVPVEFVERSILKSNKVTKMLEYGTHNQEAGTWSDETSLLLATITSLTEKKKIDYIDIMDNYLAWYEEGLFTPKGRVFDISSQIANSLSIYKRESPNYICGSDNIFRNGNGSLTRVLPISLYLHFNKDNKFETVKTYSSLTHAHPYSYISSLIYTIFICEYLNNLDIEKSYLNTKDITKKIIEKLEDDEVINKEEIKHEFNRLIYEDIRNINESDIKSSGYVIDSIEATFYSILTTNSFKEATLKAVNLGFDSDSIGALTGGLAGLIYGYNDIPTNFINTLKKIDYIEKIVDDYIKFLEGK